MFGARPLAPRQARQGQARAGDRAHPRSPRGAGRLPDRHRAGLRHRRRRDGAVVAARRARRRHGRLGEFWRGLGHRCRQAAQARRCPRHRSRLRPAARSRDDRFRSRRGFHLERHDLGRARSQRRFHSGRPRRADHLRRHLGGVRAAARLRKARCRHLLLAEGAGRRGRAWHADPVAARRRAARDLQAGLAAAEDLPADLGRQAQRRHLQGRDDQHAVDAVRRGLSRRAGLGQGALAGSMRWSRAPTPISRSSTASSPRRHGSAIWPSIRRRAPTPRSACRSSIPRSPRSMRTRRRHSPRGWSRRWRRKASPTTSAPIATRRRGCASGPARRSRAPISRR